eukprot:TRINITY_DN1301_c0_g1_i5.p1 TRINITY_DN1301_c0_g1~~TRINITY_DN1301_c0_g1_i5.p1  ORF type:complete len:240 (-),score=58.56 TRINITY_DN1301_c0_g1_i5:106-825(-)
MRLVIAVSLLLVFAASSSIVRVSRETSTFRDTQNRTLIFHGLNFVEKSPPFFPNITDADKAKMKSMGMTIVRLGVMMSGLFPDSPVPSQSYLDQIERIVADLYGSGFHTILDLHQDVLAPRICGEGLPNWMVNVSTLGAKDFPFPLSIPGTSAPSAASGSYQNLSCTPTGPPKFIGWSEFYGTDACGKAFQQIYDGVGLMGQMVERYWDLSLIHISEPTRLLSISYAVFCLKKKKKKNN